MTKEIWKNYPDAPDLLMVSNMGRIRTKDRMVNSGKGQRLQQGQLLSLSDDKDGYKLFCAIVKGKRRTIKAHRAVMITFSNIDNSSDLEVNHIDGDKKNNTLSNLEWVTRIENVYHAIDAGLITFEKVFYEKKCEYCKKEFFHEKSKTKFCSHKCYNLSRRRVERPNKEKLFDLLKNNSFTTVGRVFWRNR